MTFIGGASNAGGLFLNWATRSLGRTRGRGSTRTACRCGRRTRGASARRTTTPTAGRCCTASTSPTTPRPCAAPPSRPRASSARHHLDLARRTVAAAHRRHGRRRAGAGVGAGAGRLHRPAGRRGRGARGRRAGRRVHRPRHRRARVVDERRAPAGRERRTGSSPTRRGPAPSRSATRGTASWPTEGGVRDERSRSASTARSAWARATARSGPTACSTSTTRASPSWSTPPRAPTTRSSSPCRVARPRRSRVTARRRAGGLMTMHRRTRAAAVQPVRPCVPGRSVPALPAHARGGAHLPQPARLPRLHPLRRLPDGPQAPADEQRRSATPPATPSSSEQQPAARRWPRRWRASDRSSCSTRPTTPACGGW